MADKKNGVMDAFIEKYKKLPAMNRIGLIKTARFLSDQQKEDTKEVDNASIPENDAPQEKRRKKGLE